MVSKRRTGRHAEEHENNERWLITYADMITLLMVFFIVMYAMGQTDAKKFGAISTAIEKAFSVGVLQGQSQSGLSAVEGNAAIQTILAARQNEASSASVVDLQSRIQRLVQMSAMGSGILVLPHPEGILVRVAGNLLFDSGRADLKPEALGFLDSLSATLLQADQTIRIEGHTDSIQIDSVLYPSNWELSTARAVAVLRYLSEFGKISPDRLSAIGYGEYKPIASNRTREGRASNRRVDIVIIGESTQTGRAGTSTAGPQSTERGPQGGT